MIDQNISIDEYFLSILLQDKQSVVTAIEEDKLTGTYFNAEWRSVYVNIVLYYKKFKEVLDKEKVFDQLKRRGVASVELSKRYAVYMSLDHLKAPVKDYKYYVDAIKTRHFKGMLHEAVSKADKTCNSMNDPVTAAKDLAKVGSEIVTLAAQDRVVRTSLAESAPTMKDIYQTAKTNPELIRGVMTGFWKLDELTWGVNAGEVLLIVGPTGGGKSISLISMSAYITSGIRYCAKCGFQLFLYSKDRCPKCGTVFTMPTDIYTIPPKNVAYVSIEMPAEDCLRRFCSASLGLKEREIRRGQLNEQDEQTYLNYLESVRSGKGPVGFYVIDVPCGEDINFIATEVDGQEALHGIKMDVVIIDYLQIMKATTENYRDTGEDWKKQTAISEEVHEYARNKRIPVISAAQSTSIRSIRGETARYGTHRVSRAEGTAYNVNIIAQIEDPLEKQEEERQENDTDLTMKLYLVKNRGGERGVIVMQKDFSRMQIYHVLDVSYATLEGS